MGKKMYMVARPAVKTTQVFFLVSGNPLWLVVGEVFSIFFLFPHTDVKGVSLCVYNVYIHICM